jgi:hypothetical protein
MGVDITAELSKQHEEAVAALKRKRLDLPKRPRNTETPKLPDDITLLDDDGLMELLVRFTRYQDHIAGLLALCEIDETEAEAKLEIAKAKHLVKGWTGSSSDRVAISKAEATVDTDVQDMNDLYHQAKARRKVFSVMVNTMANGAAVVSRELTRRTGSNPAERRSSRYGG